MKVTSLWKEDQRPRKGIKGPLMKTNGHWTEDKGPRKGTKGPWKVDQDPRKGTEGPLPVYSEEDHRTSDEGQGPLEEEDQGPWKDLDSLMKVKGP